MAFPAQCFGRRARDEFGVEPSDAALATRQDRGSGLPRRTIRLSDVIEKLNMEVNAAFGNASISARLSELGASALPRSPTEFRRFIRKKNERYARDIRSVKIAAT
jgi:hypothetical protein